MMPHYSTVSIQFYSSTQIYTLIFFLASSCSPLISLASARPTLTLQHESSDRLALLSFKSLISHDPDRALASWRNVSLDFCQWNGVTCAEAGGQPRVTSLELDYLNLTGLISPSLGNLTSLKRLQLSNNGLHGPIPTSLWNLSSLTQMDLRANRISGSLPGDMGRFLPNLHRLSLSENQIHGTIPSSVGDMRSLSVFALWGNMIGAQAAGDDNWEFVAAMANCTNLILLDLGDNLLAGVIPDAIASLKRLQVLSLSYNLVTGTIPSLLGNLTELTQLHLAYNHLTGGIPHSLGSISSLVFLYLSENDQLGGDIPPSLGNLQNLTELYLRRNGLTGTIPPSLWNCSALMVLNLGDNKLMGTLSSDIGEALPRLQYLTLYYNQFEGLIPASLSNASALKWILLPNNKFQGIIPPSLGALPSLSYLSLRYNQLEASGATDWMFLDSLANCSKLQALDITRNKLEGVLPDSIANLSAGMDFLALGQNKIQGSIPSGIGSLVNLTNLQLDYNLLGGSIPPSIGRLQQLGVLRLDANEFTGEIPANIGNLTRLTKLYLGYNHLRGSISVSLGNCSLEKLSLTHNKLTGTVPKEILLIPFLSDFLDLSHNMLMGPLPSEVGSLRNLRMLDVSQNRLSGAIPTMLGQCQVMEFLHMDGNIFSGTIPLSLQELRGLQMLDLSLNSLSGLIPKFLESLPFLAYLNLSNNNLKGEVPVLGVFGNISYSSIVGNPQLCGGPEKLHLSACPNRMRRRRYLAPILLLVIVLVVLIFVTITCYKISKEFLSRLELLPSTKDQEMVGSFSRRVHMKVSYDELFHATDGFSMSNLIGMGGFSSVYKGAVDWNGNKVIVAKVFDFRQKGASKHFEAECKILKCVRHRNLVKVLASCSDYDLSGNKFNALVLSYMPNGSLEMWLHPEENYWRDQLIIRLNLIQRLNIAIDVAFGLDYLHHHCPEPIIHCDLKPSNILLDQDMRARVSDFGLSRFLDKISLQYSTSSGKLLGSIGYAAPEYGMANKASMKGDVYSFGVLLLELFTGKRPTDVTLENGLSLCKYVEAALPEKVKDIVDYHLLLEWKDGETNDNSQSISDARTKACFASVFKIGIACTKELPSERMQIQDVIKELMETRIALMESISKDKKEII